jgi:hypothetical protein
LFSFGRYKIARFVELGVTVLLGAVLSQFAYAEDFSTSTNAGFSAFAVEDLDLRMPLQSSSGAVEAGSVTAIPGYPLSQEELSLVLHMSEPGSGFSQKPADVEFAAEQNKQSFHVRLVTWIKQRSSNFNLFKLFDADDSEPGLRVDVDTDEEELVLQYRVGF